MINYHRNAYTINDTTALNISKDFPGYFKVTNDDDKLLILMICFLGMLTDI